MANLTGNKSWFISRAIGTDLFLQPTGAVLLFPDHFQFLFQPVPFRFPFGLGKLGLQKLLFRFKLANDLFDVDGLDLLGFAFLEAFEILVEFLDGAFKFHGNPHCLTARIAERL
ncbi:MAG: hypothetical protein GY717_18470 [Rhodobacteraceae bacterium]|nr:hypothetical protein [Paracoccaceae bacterium]